MISLSTQLTAPYLAVASETKRVWFFRLLYSLLTYTREKYKHRLDALYITSLGLINVVESIPPQQAKEELAAVISIQQSMLGLEPYLEQCAFLSDNEVKEKWNICLDALSHLEGELRVKAYAGEIKTDSDHILIDALAEKSTINLSNVLSKYAV